MALNILPPADGARTPETLDFPLAGEGHLQLHADPFTGIPILAFSGKIGGAVEKPLEKIRQALTAMPGYAVVDFTACEYLCSTALGSIATLALERHESGHALFLCHVGRKVRLLLSVLDLDDFFHLRDTVEAALAEAVEQGRN